MTRGDCDLYTGWVYMTLGSEMGERSVLSCLVSKPNAEIMGKDSYYLASQRSHRMVTPPCKEYVPRPWKWAQCRPNPLCQFSTTWARSSDGSGISQRVEAMDGAQVRKLPDGTSSQDHTGLETLSTNRWLQGSHQTSFTKHKFKVEITPSKWILTPGH